jgi:hypothetical protein
MKPTKNQFYCNDCGKIKMRFETEKNANTFLKFNADEIEEQSGHRPIRSYYCIACNSWHITSKKDIKNLKSKTEVVLEIYKMEMDEKKIISEKPEYKKIEHSQPKDFILKQTKAKRDKLKKLLNTLQVNIDMIKKLWKTRKTYECNQILNDSYALINVFNKTIQR